MILRLIGRSIDSLNTEIGKIREVTPARQNCTQLNVDVTNMPTVPKPSGNKILKMVNPVLFFKFIFVLSQ